MTAQWVPGPSDAGIEARRAAAAHLADLDDVLDTLDYHAAALLARTEDLLAEEPPFKARMELALGVETSVTARCARVGHCFEVGLVVLNETRVGV